MSAVSASDDQFWRAYSAAIVQKLLPTGAVTSDSGLAVFIATQDTRGIGAGDTVPVNVTNFMTYEVADSLLPATNPLYVPGGAGRYFQALQRYLDNIEVIGETSDAHQYQLIKSKEQLEDVQKGFDKIDSEADERYEKHRDGNKKGNTFEMWANQYAKDWIRAKESVEAASAQYSQLLRDSFGTDGAVLADYRDELKLAANKLSSVPGYNMPATMLDLNMLQDMKRASDAGRPAPAAGQEGKFFRPAYSIQGLGAAVNQWMRETKKGPTTTIDINMAAGQNTSWSDLGFSHVDASARRGNCFFSASVSASADSKHENLKVDDLARQVSVQLTAIGAKSFPISPGAWDVKDLSGFKLRKDAPQELVNGLVKPESVLLAYGVGLKVTFSQELTSKVHDMLETSKKAGGSVNVCGFSIGASVSTSSLTTFDNTSFDKQSGVLEIKPEFGAYPVLLGAVGRRVSFKA